jgi:VIT1/CCC1 family predicted Fe2+/Mn2+ transporter
LIPYLLLAELDFAALVSTVLAAGTLFMTGLFKTKATGGRWYMGAAEFVLIGMGALATGYLVGSVVRGVL